MNKTVSDGKLKQNRGQAAGKFNQLVGSLQQRFGYSRKRAQRELKRRVARHQIHAAGR